jgi:hypothetical protein
MSWGSPVFVLGIIALCTIGGIITTWIRAKHGYPVADEWSGKLAHRSEEPATARKIELLASENAALKGQIGRLEERISVLERIATDGTARLSREIDALR